MTMHRVKNPKHKLRRAVAYDRIRLRLEQERTDLQHCIDRTERQLLNTSTEGTNIINPTDSHQEALVERRSHYQHRLKLVIQGLQRIRDCTFGVCQICEEPIARKRLQALPTARYCINCQEEQERTEAESSDVNCV